MEQVHPLKAFRERQRPPISQRQLADMLGVKPATVCRWEKGKRLPERDYLDGISTATGIPAAKLRPDLAGLFSPTTRSKRGRAA